MADPFDMFGDESDGDDSESPSELAASILVNRANDKIDAARASNQETKNSTTKSDAARAVSLEHIEKLDLPWDKPLYLGPMILVSSLPVGGARGYVASRRLEPGTLVLVEDPMFAWPAEQIGQALGLSSIKGLIEHENGNRMIQDMEVFHPTKEHVDGIGQDETTEGRIQILEMMDMLRSNNAEESWNDLLKLSREKEISSRNGQELTETDLVRLLVALRYNGLETGLYRHVAMLNHDCRPNCVKMRPSDTSYSEVRTTRVVEAGESLSISYLPRIVSHASRRKHLWEQHRFDIGANLKGKRLSMELIDDRMPVSSVNKWDEGNLTHRIETATEELENFYQESLVNVTNAETSSQAWEYCKALEVSAMELYNESVSQLKNDRHQLLIPILVLHLDVCELVRKAQLSKASHLKVLARSVVSARTLLSLQEEFHGPDHFDLARTTLDLAEAIGELLSNSPKHLLELGIPSLTNFGAWSSYEDRQRKQHNRIRSIYPYDTLKYIESG